jgi:hypothetical protein
MLRLLTGVLLLVFLTACQHQLNIDTAYRIDRVIVEPVSHRYGSIPAAQLKTKFQAVANDINEQLPPSVASRDLIVKVESMRYVAPNGLFVLGRSRINGTIHTVSSSDSQTYRFSASDSGQPDVADAFGLEGYFDKQASFDRITENIAVKFSKLYAAEHGTEPIRRDRLARIASQHRAVPVKRGEVPPPPLILVGQ